MKRFAPLNRLVYFVILFLFFSFSCSKVRAGEYSIEKYSLKNGLTVLLKEVPESSVVSVAMVYRVGSRNESSSNAGISKLLEHMLRQNTKKFPLWQIPEFFTWIGAQYNSFTSNDVTGFCETTAPEYLDILLEIEADRMINGNLTPEEMELGKKIISSKIAYMEKNPSYVLWKRVRESSFINHPYKRPVEGYGNNLKSINLYHLRKYYKKYYKPKNAVLAVVGNFSKRKVKSSIVKIFGKIESGVSNFNDVIIPEPLPESEKRIVINNLRSYPLVHISFHVPSVDDKDMATMAVIDSILTLGNSSRLKRALMGGGYVFSVSAWLDNNVDFGLYYLQCKLKRSDDIFKVEKILKKNIDSLKSGEVSCDELNRAKVLLKAQFIRTHDTISRQAQFLAWYEAIGSYKYIDDYNKNIDAVTVSDIKRVASKYFIDSAKVVGILSYKEDKIESSSQKNERYKDNKKDSGFNENINSSSYSFKKIDSDEELCYSKKISSGLLLARKKYFTIKKKKKKSKATKKKKYKKKSKQVKKKINKKSKKKKKFYSKKVKKKIYKKKIVKKNRKRKISKKFKVNKRRIVNKPHKNKFLKIAPLGISVSKILMPKSCNIKFKKHILSNGVTLLVHENKINPSVCIESYIKAGGIYEKSRQAGIARMTALLMDKNLLRACNSKKVGNLDSLGVKASFTSNVQNVEFSLWTPSSDIKKAVFVMAKVISNPKFSKSELKVIKKLMLSRFKSENRNSKVLSLKNFYYGIYPEKHPFHYSRWGTEETIENIMIKDINRFYEKYYRPDSTIIAISGDVKTTEIISLFEKAFLGWKSKKSIPQLVISEVNLPSGTDEKVIPVMAQRNVEIVMGHKAIPRTHPDFYKFNMMNYILGGAPMISRLSKKVQGGGLAYNIKSHLDTSLGDGPWSVRMCVEPGKVSDAIKAVKEQMRYLQEKPPTNEEVKKACCALLGSFPVQMQSNKNISLMLLNIEYYGLGKDYLNKYYNAYRSITPLDIQQTAKKYLYPENMTVIISGPYK